MTGRKKLSNLITAIDNVIHLFLRAEFPKYLDSAINQSESADYPSNHPERPLLYKTAIELIEKRERRDHTELYLRIKSSFKSSYEYHRCGDIKRLIWIQARLIRIGNLIKRLLSESHGRETIKKVKEAVKFNITNIYKYLDWSVSNNYDQNNPYYLLSEYEHGFLGEADGSRLAGLIKDLILENNDIELSSLANAIKLSIDEKLNAVRSNKIKDKNKLFANSKLASLEQKNTHLKTKNKKLKAKLKNQCVRYYRLHDDFDKAINVFEAQQLNRLEQDQAFYARVV